MPIKTYSIKMPDGSIQDVDVDDKPEPKMSAAVPNSAFPADTPMTTQGLAPGGPAAVRFAGGAIRSAAPTVGKVAQFVGENFPTLTNPGKPIAAMLRAGGKALAGSAAPAAEAATGAAEAAPVAAGAGRSIIHAAGQSLPDLKQLEIAARAQGLPPAQVQQVLRAATRNLLLSNLNKF